jgi:hypothetical protein
LGERVPEQEERRRLKDPNPSGALSGETVLQCEQVDGALQIILRLDGGDKRADDEREPEQEPDIIEGHAGGDREGERASVQADEPADQRDPAGG